MRSKKPPCGRSCRETTRRLSQAPTSSFCSTTAKEQSKGLARLTAAGVLAAHRVFLLVETSGVEDAQRRGQILRQDRASSYLRQLKLETNGNFISQGKGYNPPGVARAGTFCRPVNQILTGGAASTYIIVSDGDFTNEVADIAKPVQGCSQTSTPKQPLTLLSLTRRTQRSTQLVKKLQEAGLSEQINLVKVATPSEITGIAKKIIQARLDGKAFKAPVAVSEDRITASTSTELVKAVQAGDTRQVIALVAERNAARPAR